MITISLQILTTGETQAPAKAQQPTDSITALLTLRAAGSCAQQTARYLSLAKALIIKLVLNETKKVTDMKI